MVELVATDEIAEGRIADEVLATTVAVGFPPFKHVQALDIFAGTLDHCAAKAGTVWVGPFV